MKHELEIRFQDRRPAQTVRFLQRHYAECRIMRSAAVIRSPSTSVLLSRSPGRGERDELIRFAGADNSGGINGLLPPPGGLSNCAHPDTSPSDAGSCSNAIGGPRRHSRAER